MWNRKLATPALLLALGASVAIGADALLKDRSGSGVQTPTKALGEQYGKRDPRNLVSPVLEIECVSNEFRPIAEWKLEKRVLWTVPGMVLRPAWMLVDATLPATGKIEADAPGYTEIVFPDPDSEPWVVKGNATDLGRRLALATGSDYVQVLFDAR